MDRCTKHDVSANLKRTQDMDRWRERETEQQRGGWGGGGGGGTLLFDLTACLPCCFPSRLPGKFQETPAGPLLGIGR